ncbi:MAG: hypothetical protein QG654_7 [Patescibacteria group bacterium]|nr:hypothetical protein [Patescibacteria group bacterium]
MSLDWSSKRKLGYLGAFLFAIIGISIFILWPYFNQEPTCFDRKQNGDEAGIDCGGSCLLTCSADTYKLVTLWSRAFPVTGGSYNLMAYVENQNREAGISKINYEFRVYDEENIFMARREGSTFITSNDRTAIFEGGIEAGNRKPSRVDFTFTSVPVWLKINREQRNALSVSVEDKALSNPFESPKINANVVNNTLRNIEDLDIFVVLYDEEDNVINVSKTFVENLPKNSKLPIVFTWPEPLSKNPSRVDIFPQVNIFELGI